MTSLQRYIFRQVFVTTVFVAFGMTALITLFGSLKLVDFVINRGLPITVLLELVALRIPKFLTIILPLAAVTSILVVYNRLLSESELVVMRSAGMSQWALARPGLVVGLITMLFVFGFNLYVAPIASASYKQQQFDYRNTYGSILLQEGRFNTPMDGVTVYARTRESRGDMRGIFAHDARKPDQPITYLAERATAVQTDTGMRVVLFKGSRQQMDKGTGRLTLFYFDQYSLDLGLFNSDGDNRWKQPEERFLGELFNPDESASDQYHRVNLISEGHNRLASPLNVMAFCLVALAALLGGSFNRRGQNTRILVAIGVIVVLQLVGLGIYNLAHRSLAFVPMLYLLPIAAMLAAGCAMVRKASRMVATPAAAGGEASA
jgi:lipopolysaccharide export system permease protein